LLCAHAWPLLPTPFTPCSDLSTCLLLYAHVCIPPSRWPGIWTKDLKIQTNLAQPQLTKILKTLESSRLVKSIKGVAHPSRKLYILADIEPAREITGGAW
jgi:DNA-directed RNA polymerase III subunit RPC6